MRQSSVVIWVTIGWMDGVMSSGNYLPILADEDECNQLTFTRTPPQVELILGNGRIIQ